MLYITGSTRISIIIIDYKSSEYCINRENKLEA